MIDVRRVKVVAGPNGRATSGVLSQLTAQLPAPEDISHLLIREAGPCARCCGPCVHYATIVSLAG